MLVHKNNKTPSAEALTIGADTTIARVTLAVGSLKVRTETRGSAADAIPAAIATRRSDHLRHPCRGSDEPAAMPASLLAGSSRRPV